MYLTLSAIDTFAPRFALGFEQVLGTNVPEELAEQRVAHLGAVNYPLIVFFFLDYGIVCRLLFRY